MTHLHTPREVVLGGNALDVRRVVELLLAETPGAEAFPAPVRSAIHCAAMAGTHQALFELHRLPVADRPPFRFYSAADYGPTALEPDRLAQNLADATTRPVDFVRLVERSWEDGARVFVELGPGAACSRWIGEILSGRAHAALSVSGRGVDEATALVRAVARLVAERVPLRLDAFAGAAQVAPPATRSAVRTVQVGGRDLVPFGPRQDHRSAPVFGKTELLAFAGGRIAEAFGPAYAPIDGYRRRVRLPLPPYLLVSRVTALTGHRGVFEPCAVTTEYDVPHGAFYSVDGQVPLAVAVESGQCDLLLISYLGVDFDSRGDRVYRLLDCTLTFLDELPMEGDTLRYEIRIDSFARTGATLLFFFAYDCYVGDRRILEMRGGCAGFFTDAELAEGRGVIDSPDYLAARARAQAAVFDAPLRCGRSSFDSEDLRRLAAGDLAACFGPEHALGGANPSLRLPPEAMRMVDRVVRIDSNGGAWGLGLLEAEKDLAPGDWYFPCHFQGDEVLAGSLMADGCSQLLQLYLLYLGLHANTLDARFQPVAGVSQRVICRGQVTPEGRLLAYRLEITALEGGARPSARANCDIVVDGRTVVRFTDLAVELAEKAVTRTPVLYDERQVRAFTIGSVAACFGPEFARFDAPGRRVPRSPNGDLQLVSRVLDASARGPRPEPGAWLVSEYEMPRDPWFTRANGYPVTPYSILMEIALQPCGFLSAHQGTSFVFPDSDLYFRNLDGSGFLHREIDLRGRTLRNRVVLTSTTSLSGVILQKFTYALECEAEALFDGNAAFGYFEAAALGQQAGLDGGRCVPTWLAEAGVPAGWVELGDGHRLIDARPGRPHERLPAARLHLLDRAAVIPGGGRHGLGYVLAEKAVDPSSWFFACHFHHDPVMPGSLGVETIVEAFQYLIMSMGLTDGFRSPRFGHVSGSRTVWKYRGQVLADARSIAVEVHVTGVEEWHGTRVVKADASLWRDGLRIYELTDLAQSVSEAGNERQRPLVERFAGAGEQ
jgi:3-hydroxymyristoyl/3-hydroxydecanoyl-(acyl carrier protein) dehydratase